MNAGQQKPQPNKTPKKQTPLEKSRLQTTENQNVNSFRLISE